MLGQDRQPTRRTEQKAIMPSALDLNADRRRQARKTVQIALLIAFSGAMLGVFFGVALGAVSTAEVWLIGLCALVTVGLLILISVQPAMATGVITGSLSVFFAIYLNAVAILAYRASEEMVAIVPYITWFFPLVMFHQFTNFGFFKRSIDLLVSLAPVPIATYVLVRMTDPRDIAEVGAIVAFLASFFAFVLFVGFFTRHRDQEILSAAMAEEAERSAAVLRVSEERFRLLGRATNDLIWDADLKSEWIWWNETLQNVYGYSPEAFDTNMSAWENWIHLDDRDRVVENLRSVIESGESNWTSEYRFLCADGRALDVVARGLVLRDHSGEAIRLIGSTTDVTELRALEKKLRQSQKLEAVGQLTGGIAHDFNNLLTIIVGSAETLADIHAKDPRAQQLAKVTMQAAERGATLTSHLLSYARRQALAPEHLDPVAVLTGLEGLICRTINEDIQIQMSAAPGVWPIEVDPGQFENAILNLVINARDAMPDGGKLTIAASNATFMADDLLRAEEVKEGGYVSISVTDNGCGMTPEVLERAFEPFFTTKEVGKGSGLGLSMVWGFVQQSNGLARIYSEPGEGTSVKLYFPAADRKEKQESASVPNTGLIGGTERILVVEDDDMVRSHVVSQLRSLGYDCKEAASGADAIEIMERGHDFDLLFTDVVMPGGMNGRQLADAARLRQPDLRIIFTSGYAEDAIVHQGRLDPGVNLLSKPYRRADLAEKVRRVLDG
ncbi:MAG: response regulator [Pararhodobacter sp.]|nr:response regulator [Pararhodobacter sp.]